MEVIKLLDFLGHPVTAPTNEIILTGEGGKKIVNEGLIGDETAYSADLKGKRKAQKSSVKLIRQHTNEYSLVPWFWRHNDMYSLLQYHAE